MTQQTTHQTTHNAQDATEDTVDKTIKRCYTCKYDNEPMGGPHCTTCLLQIDGMYKWWVKA